MTVNYMIFGFFCVNRASILCHASSEVFLYLGEIILFLGLFLGRFVERGVVLSGGDVVSCCEGEVSCIVCVGGVAGDDCVDVSCVDGAGVSCVDGVPCCCPGLSFPIGTAQSQCVVIVVLPEPLAINTLRGFGSGAMCVFVSGKSAVGARRLFLRAVPSVVLS